MDHKHTAGGYLKNDLDVNQNASSVSNFIQLSKSKGSYVVDCDGNTMLDVSSTELNPLGYNHDSFKKAFNSPDYDAAIINNGLPGGAVATDKYRKIVRSSISLAPVGFRGVVLSNHSNAVADAVRQAMLLRAQNGQTNFQALTFHGSCHGSPLAYMNNHPKVAYPTSQADEAEILESVRHEMRECGIYGNTIAAIVIEPTQYLTGYVASENFITELKSIAAEYEAALVVDETGTGFGATGKGLWQYNQDSDYLVFGKRSMVSGYFSKE
mmetsp:Transcript_4556/g.6893  ORF Transcript_4556/g.6893 Transcript_4556/m.6893 type:complete len:268 (-) Transcript_4556:401-1204(-)